MGRKWITSGDANYEIATHMADDQELSIKLLSGFNDCLLGVTNFETHACSIYSVSQIIDVLSLDMERDEAYEYFGFNIERAVEHEQSSGTAPILCYDLTESLVKFGDVDDEDEPEPEQKTVPPPSMN